MFQACGAACLFKLHSNPVLACLAGTSLLWQEHIPHPLKIFTIMHSAGIDLLYSSHALLPSHLSVMNDTHLGAVNKLFSINLGGAAAVTAGAAANSNAISLSFTPRETHPLHITTHQTRQPATEAGRKAARPEARTGVTMVTGRVTSLCNYKQLEEIRRCGKHSSLWNTPICVISACMALLQHFFINAFSTNQCSPSNLVFTPFPLGLKSG